MFNTPVKRIGFVLVLLLIILGFGSLWGLIIPKFSLTEKTGVTLVLSLLMNGLMAVTTFIIIPIIVISIICGIKNWVSTGDIFNFKIRLISSIVGIFVILGQGLLFLKFVIPHYPSIFNQGLPITIPYILQLDVALFILEAFASVIFWLLGKSILWIVRG
jgi:hypothetical protein